MISFDPTKPLALIGQPFGNYTFFRDVMSQLFGKKFRDLNDGAGKLMPSWERRSNQMDGTWAPEIDCIGGIFDAGAGNCVCRCCPADSQFILIVADPFATAVESYRVAKSESEAGQFWIQGKQSHVDEHFRSIDEFLEQFPRSIYDHLPTELALDNFQKQFSQRYVHVGLADTPKQSAEHIAAAVGRHIRTMPDLPPVDQTASLPEHLR